VRGFWWIWCGIWGWLDEYECGLFVYLFVEVYELFEDVSGLGDDDFLVQLVGIGIVVELLFDLVVVCLFLDVYCDDFEVFVEFCCYIEVGLCECKWVGFECVC